jgi:uncharacterized protein (TIGR00369 family)
VLNPVGSIHGGVINSLCSVVSSLAALSVVDEDKYTVANDFNISFIKSVSSGKLIFEGKVLKAGRNLVFVETRVKDESGNIVATGRVTKSVIP